MSLIALVMFSMVLTPVKVEVFYNGAKITYSARYMIKSGYNEIVLTGLLPGSRIIGVNVSKPCKLVGFNAIDSTDLNDLSTSKLRSRYDSLKMKHELLSWTYRIVESEKNLLLNLLSDKKLDSLKLNASRLSLFLDMVKQKSRALAEEGYKVNKKLKEIEKLMHIVSDSLRVRTKDGVKVVIWSRSQRKADIHVDVFNSGIFYYPEYSLNAIPDKNRVILLAAASIKNNTSVKLKNVELSLVMQNFSYGGIVNVEPERYYYDTYYTKGSRRKAMARMELSAPQSDEAVVFPQTPVVEKYATGEKILLKGRYTLNKSTYFTVSMFEDTLKASFLRRAYPKRYEGVWLYGSVRAGRYPIELKNVKMSIDGVYQGRWSHPARDIAFPEDTFFASFGRDKNVEVKREIIKSKVSENWQGKEIKRFHYRITLTNHWRSDVKVVLYDNIPLFHSDIYKLKNVKIEPKEYELNRESGIIMWDILVPASGKKVFNILYDVLREE